MIVITKNGRPAAVLVSPDEFDGWRIGDIRMINHLIATEADHSLLKKLHLYQSQELLVIDEIGYLPLGQQGSNWFFQVISHRHEVKSTIITTNLPFAQWGNIFDSTTVATAIADRLVYNSQVLILEGKSYRKRTNPAE